MGARESVHVRLSQAEQDAIGAAAALKKSAASTYIRETAVKAARRELVKENLASLANKLGAENAKLKNKLAKGVG